jgi:hypothetical protein
MTFSVRHTFYFLFYSSAVPEGRTVALGTSVFTLGVTVGAYWEIFEWFVVGKYTMADTISDLLVGSAGALAAALVALALRRSGDRLT